MKAPGGPRLRDRTPILRVTGGRRRQLSQAGPMPREHRSTCADIIGPLAIEGERRSPPRPPGHGRTIAAIPLPANLRSPWDPARKTRSAIRIMRIASGTAIPSALRPSPEHPDSATQRARWISAIRLAGLPDGNPPARVPRKPSGRPSPHRGDRLSTGFRRSENRSRPRRCPATQRGPRRGHRGIDVLLRTSP